MNQLPHIPNDAPFTPEQRAWLNGLLAGLFSSTPEKRAGAPGLDVAVCFASQGGTAERLAKKIAKELKAQGHQASVLPVDKVTPAELTQKAHVTFLASTYGDGDPPDHAVAFRDALFADGSPRMDSLRYSVFCLGDRNYEHFCKFGVELDERLAELGANRMAARVESDVDVDEAFARWKNAVLRGFTAQSKDDAVVSPTLSSAGAEPVASRHSRENPYYAEVVEQRALTQERSSKLTMHLALRLGGALAYEAGDACGVLAENDPDLVDETLALLRFDGATMVEVPKTSACTLREALLRHYQHTRLTRKIVQAFADKTGCKTLSALLPAEQGVHLEQFVYDRGLIDLLLAYPEAMETPAELLTILPRLSPRLYSISSSPAAHRDELHCTVGVVRYNSHGRERGGVASTMLAQRMARGDRVPVYIQPNKRFRLPQDGDVPIIMVGPGTGIAPFRSFLHERQALGHKGRNWLFFGERSAHTDFLYCHELREMYDSGHLTRFDTAFSRDQVRKIYVQDRMVEHGAEFWKWLGEGARVYVCGDASRMAKDVDTALHAVIEKHGAMSAEEAKEYVGSMHDEGRYHRDVY